MVGIGDVKYRSKKIQFIHFPSVLRPWLKLNDEDKSLQIAGSGNRYLNCCSKMKNEEFFDINCAQKLLLKLIF